MSTEDTNTVPEIPNDAIIVRPSMWAWLWAVVPWAVLAIVSLYVDQITFVGLPLLFAAIIIIPRYISYRGMTFTLLEDYVVVKRGRQRYDLPINQINQIESRPGMFGQSLGYTFVYLVLIDGKTAVLQHVPASSPIVAHINKRLNQTGPVDEEALDQEG